MIAWSFCSASTSKVRGRPSVLAGADGSVLWEAWAAPGGRHVLLCALCGSLRTLGDCVADDLLRRLRDRRGVRDRDADRDTSLRLRVLS